MSAEEELNKPTTSPARAAAVNIFIAP